MDPAAHLCEIARRAYARQLVSGMEGNLSIRRDDGHVLCTPTMRCKGLLNPEHLCVIDLAGNRVSGSARPSSEMPMHLAIYRADARVRAVVHTHPPFATAFAVLGETIPTEFLPEAALFFGEIPLAPYATTGTPAMGDVLRPLVPGHCAALLANHGAVTWGPDLERAYAYMDSLEAICRVLHHARQIGIPRAIGAEHLRELRAIRARLLEAAETGMGS